jgi:hypothetical protein
LQIEPIELGERLDRWPVGRGPLLVLLPARLRQLIDEGELPPGEPRSLAVGLGNLAAAREQHAVLAYVISTFHNPTGSVLPRSPGGRSCRPVSR